MEFTAIQEEILRKVQANLPSSLTPYAQIAQEVGVTEEEVITFLQSLKESGVIRRFGASIKHQRVGYKHNAMVAWEIDDSLIDEAGEIAAKHKSISHCYHRPSPDRAAWPYTLFTMIHGMEESDIQEVIQELIAGTTLEKYAILESIQELKKISMTYFA